MRTLLLTGCRRSLVYDAIGMTIAAEFGHKISSNILQTMLVGGNTGSIR
jgi:hypothetical protein